MAMHLLALIRIIKHKMGFRYLKKSVHVLALSEMNVIFSQEACVVYRAVRANL